MPWSHDDVAIGELELTRAAGDRRLYALADTGIVRLKRWASRAASAEANARSMETARRGLWRCAAAGQGHCGNPRALDPAVPLFAGVRSDRRVTLASARRSYSEVPGDSDAWSSSQAGVSGTGAMTLPYALKRPWSARPDTRCCSLSEQP